MDPLHLMNMDEVREKFKPAVEEIIRLCRVNDVMFDKEMFQIYLATIWGNAVLNPGRSDIDEKDLAILHDFLNEELQALLGPQASLTNCYEFIISTAGDDSIRRLKIAKRHKEFLHYFARLILSREVQS